MTREPDRPPVAGSSGPAPELDWSLAELERLTARAASLVTEHLTSIPDRPVFQPYPRELAEELLAEPMPRYGASSDAILDDFARLIEPYPFGNGHPRFFGWVNSPPLPIAVIGDALAAAMNPSVAGGNHAAVWLEHQVLGWLRSMVGLPASAAGLLVSGASAATVTALAVARHVATNGAVRSDGLQSGPGALTVYTSEEGHSCIRKAVELLGIGSSNLRLIGTDADRRLDVGALEVAIADDLAAGRRPMAVAASAGTVNSGAIDPLAAVADVCRRRGVWCHVDAAYGGPAILTDRFATALAPLGEADSVALDPHKWLSIPIEAGAVFVRDAAAMRDAFSLVPAYLRTDEDPHGVGGPPWFSEYGLQQTRGFRALKVWMALKRYGVEGYRAAIDRTLDLAEHLAQRVEGDPRLALVARGLSIVCFRVRPDGSLDREAEDSANRAVLDAVQRGGEAFLSGTVLDGRFCLRACIVNFRTTRSDVDRLVDAVLAAARDVASS